jgi:hypoxanthine phosphoribosyltransferase
MINILLKNISIMLIISMVEKVYYSYEMLDKLCRDNGETIRKEFNPDVILAIGGGGLIPARILRNSIDVPIYVITMSTYDENNVSIEEPRIIQWMDFSILRNKRILIVDEVDDTRKTLKYLVEKLIKEDNLLSDNLGFFVLQNKKKNKTIELNELDIGYYKSGENVEDKWIEYPWE